MAFIDKVYDREQKNKRRMKTRKFCTYCDPHGGCNKCRHVEKSDRHKNHRRK